MTKNLKVKVLKKSKDAPYPEHIIVERKSTHELVHIYFDNGTFQKLTHIARDPKIKIAWDEKEKKYGTGLPNYFFRNRIVRKENDNDHSVRYLYSKGPKKQDFFDFFTSPPWDSTFISFKSHPEGMADFFIEMDANGLCLPNSYLKDDRIASIKEIYPHQKKKTHPVSKLIIDGLVKLR